MCLRHVSAQHSVSERLVKQAQNDLMTLKQGMIEKNLSNGADITFIMSRFNLSASLVSAGLLSAVALVAGLHSPARAARVRSCAGFAA
jgi:hypothetical protein